LKAFVESTGSDVPLETEVEDWLQENATVDVLDVRYALASAQDEDGNPQETHAVLLIYRGARPRGKPGAVRMPLHRVEPRG